MWFKHTAVAPRSHQVIFDVIESLEKDGIQTLISPVGTKNKAMYKTIDPNVI